LEIKLGTENFRVDFLGDFNVHGYDWVNGFSKLVRITTPELEVVLLKRHMLFLTSAVQLRYTKQESS
jgi:hypothetical protein